MGDRKYCAGCRDDFYNGKQNWTTHGCWSLKSANVVTRYRIGWWTAPTEPGAFTKVQTHHCNYAPGQYAHYEKLPAFAVQRQSVTKGDPPAASGSAPSSERSEHHQ